jgi:Ricin-type beta-trefoil lectin domain
MSARSCRFVCFAGRVAVATLLLGLTTGSLATAARAGTTTYCTDSAGRYDQIPVDGGAYMLSPDEWNSTGDLCVSTDGGADFDVTSSAITDPVDGPGAYPNLTYTASSPIPVNAMGDTLTSWATGLASATGTYDVAYDIWFADAGEPGECDFANGVPPHEMMIWLNEAGGALPYPTPTASSPTETIEHETYAVTYGGLGTAHTILNFDLTTPLTSVYDLDLRQFAAYGTSLTAGGENYYVPPQGYLCSVGVGFEIWSGDGGEQTTSFSYQSPPKTALPGGDIASSVHGVCLDAGGSAPDQSATSLPVYAWDCATTADAPGAGQNWTVHNSNTLQLYGLCLDEPSTAAGAAVKLDSCSYGGHQTWVADGNELKNLASGYCLTDPGSSAVNGTALDVSACSGATDQQWREPYDGAAVNTGFTSHVSDDCLTPTGSGTVEQGACASVPTTAADWAVNSDGAIVSAADGDCLDAVQGLTSSADPGDLAQLNPCSGAGTQQWVITPAGALMNPATQTCLDDPGSSGTLGALVDTYRCNGSGAQVWANAATKL